jgi:hypothetical protein
MFNIEKIQNNNVKALAELCVVQHSNSGTSMANEFDLEKFAMLIVSECIKSIETYEIPVGNSPAGEMAFEWTYDALAQIRDDINEKFMVNK